MHSSPTGRGSTACSRGQVVPARLARRIAVETQELTRAQRPWRRPRLERARVRAGVGRGECGVCWKGIFLFPFQMPRSSFVSRAVRRRRRPPHGVFFVKERDAGVYRVRPHVAKRPPETSPREGAARGRRVTVTGSSGALPARVRAWERADRPAVVAGRRAARACALSALDGRVLACRGGDG